MKKNRLYIVIIMVIIGGRSLYAQQDPQYTQYMYNTISVNPAYAGSRDVLSVSALHRSQWVGLDGAPTTQTISVNTPLDDFGKYGLGISVINDDVGVAHETYFNVDFSYSIISSGDSKFSFGIKAGGLLQDIAFSELTQNPRNNAGGNSDPLLAQDVSSKFSPTIGAGIYYRHADKWYLGLSVPNFIETEHLSDNNVRSVAKERINYYLIGGYVFNISDNIKLKPAFLTKAVGGAPLQVDLSANVLFNEKFTLGLGYRWDAAFSGMAGFQINDQLMIGYAYDNDTSDIQGFNNGSHEVFLRFELFRNFRRAVSSRFF